MRRIRFVIIAFLLCLGAATDGADAGESEAWTALRAGRHVALMRHADAPGGFGDPTGFTLDDCATQRNLSAKGRTDALKIGTRLRSERIVFERILSSPWCRCIDTATLLAMGLVAAELTFSNVVVLRDQRDSLTSGARAVIDQWTSGGNLLVVTHGANIQELTGIQPASGEIVVVRAGSDGSSVPVGRLTLDRREASPSAPRSGSREPHTLHPVALLWSNLAGLWSWAEGRQRCLNRQTPRG